MTDKVAAVQGTILASLLLAMQQKGLILQVGHCTAMGCLVCSCGNVALIAYEHYPARHIGVVCHPPRCSC